MIYKTIIFILIFTFIIGSNSYKDKFISITLDAKWLDTPLHQEASEFLSTQNRQYFWAFINDISSYDLFTPDALGSVQNYHDQLLSFSSRYLNSITRNLLHMALALRSYSPTVQMMRKMAHDTGMTRQCSTFVDIHGIYTCNIDEIDQLIETANQRSKFLLPFDHHYSQTQNDSLVTVVLYGDFGHQNEFQSFHTKLISLVKNDKIDYVLRHNSQSSENNRRKVRLAGYGVELQIKSTEYKATDDSKIRDDQSNQTLSKSGNEQDEQIHGFVFSKLLTLHPNKQSELNDFRTYLIDGSNPMTPLKAWQMQDLSLQCAYRALTEHTPEEAFNSLVEYSQNFPSRARLLSKIKIDSSFRESHKSNQDEIRSILELDPGQSALFINSIPQSLDTIDLYVLLNMLLNEGQMMERLHLIGLKKSHIRQLLTNELNIQSINYILDFRHPSILWLNDLENDQQYSKWSSSYYDLLRNNFFGGLRTIRKNLYNLVIILDPSEIDTSYELMKNIEAYFVHELPIRIGLVFVTKNDYSIQFYRAFRYLLKANNNPTRALNFINELYKSQSQDVKQIFSKLAKYSGSLSSIFDDDENNPFESERQAMNEYFEESGLSYSFPHVLFNGNPLTAEEILPTAFEDVITTRMLRMQFDIQQQVYHGQLRDTDDIIEILNTKPNVVRRLNQRIFGQTSSMPTVYVDLSDINGQANDIYDKTKFENLSTREQASVIMASMLYLGKKDELGQPLYPITLWIACDLDRKDGRQLFLNALTYLKSHTHARVGLLASFETPSQSGSHPITKAVYTAIRTLLPPIARTFIFKLLKDENVIEELLAGKKTWSDVTVSGLNGQKLEQEIANFNDQIFQSHGIFLQQGLQLPAGSRNVLVNGRILGPLNSHEQFTEDDFILLDKHLSTTINNRLVQIVDKLQIYNDPSQLSDLLMRISSIISQNEKNSSPVTRKQTPRISSSSKAVLHLSASNIDEPAFLVEAIIDPASRDGQRLLSLIAALRQSINLDLTIYFNCKLQLSELPLKSFYRYVYDVNLQELPRAVFHHVPETPILTLGMVTPESWMVEAVTSPYDLDNIHLEDVPIGVNANFELQYLLIEGQCYDETQNYPRGLQLILGTNQTKNLFDTIVMANLGYFQLKAYPGVWHLNLREGRSDDIYTIVSHDNTDSSTRTSQPVIIAIRSFDARWVKVYVGKKSGKENEKLLDDSSDDSGTGSGSIWDSFSFGGSSSSSSSNKQDDSTDDTINIFSVASGHLYERLLRIMMTSVLKHTKKPVKFWFLKNFLSPSFTSFLPYHAKHYNFTYELVQYKWPKWLTVYPTEKQRVIWGYKILFLDVLFPLDLKKVIFVDADQVVRADLAELRDLDLHGAPYGYVPFCENRRDMDGYRFWKSGYWASHLGHRRYHISALYVIDLKKFRKIAAGDRLRGQYYGLSQDPNSLSNLDQDLPNNMIHQVNIYSLPEEWLWCETWCDQESKKRAKTIDLCNNPQTKEPKLKAAARIIPEWTDYDQEIKTLMAQWEEEGKPKVILPSQTTNIDTDESANSINTHDPTEL